MTTKDQISDWFDRGVKDGATHMIVVCDTYGYEDYPVYVYPDENPMLIQEKFSGKNMQKVMEVYNLRGDRETQLNMTRAFCY